MKSILYISGTEFNFTKKAGDFLVIFQCDFQFFFFFFFFFHFAAYFTTNLELNIGLGNENGLFCIALP